MNRDQAIRIAADAMFDSDAAETGTRMEDLLLFAEAAVDALGMYCDDPRCAEIPVGRCLLCRATGRVSA